MPVARQESAPAKPSHHSNDDPPPLPRRRITAEKVESSNDVTSTPPMLPPRSHGNLSASRPRSIVGSTGLNYVHMQFPSDGALPLPPRGRTRTTYSELVREVSGDPAPAERVLGRSSSEDDLSIGQRNSTHEQHLDNVDLLRMNLLNNGNSHSNPDVTRDSVSPQPLVADQSPPPLPVRNKPPPTSGSHDQSSSGSHDHNPFDQADPFESGKDVSDPSDFYQTPRNTLMVANGDSTSEQQQATVSEVTQEASVTTMSTTSTVPAGYEESTMWVHVDDELEYQSPLIPYHGHYDVPPKHNPNDQDDDTNKVNPNDQHNQDDDDDEGDEYINPEVFGDHGNSDDVQVTADELEEIIGGNDSSSVTNTSSVADEYSYPTELLGMSPNDNETVLPLRATETVIPPRATETVIPPRANETVIPSRANDAVLTPRVNETVLPPRGSNDHHSSQSRPLPPLPARTSCAVPKTNSLGRTMSSLPRQQPRYDREGWIMRYVQQGYTRDQVVRALAITQNDFNMASNILKEFVKMR